MARALRIQYPGAYYHVTCRGNEKKEIFLDSTDRQVFLEKLSYSLNIYNVSLLAYTLMMNHFHILLTTPDGNLSEFMRHFNITYTSAFNRRHDRVGHLYQGRYKAFLIDADNYLLEVSRYIHLNPIKTKTYSKKPAKDKWSTLLDNEFSSLPGYLSLRKRKHFIDYAIVLSQMGGDNRDGRGRYRRFIGRGVEEDTNSPLELGKGNGIVGERGFVEQIKARFVSNSLPKREQPSLRELGKAFQPEELIDQFLRLTGKEKKEICRRGKNSVERAMLMDFLYRFCQISQPQIGRLVGGIDYSSVSQARRRLHNRIARDSELRKAYSELTSQMIDLSRPKI